MKTNALSLSLAAALGGTVWTAAPQTLAQHWCEPDPVFAGQYAALLADAGACPWLGVADDPARRNTCIPTAATPVKIVRLKFNVFARDDGSDPAATEAGVNAQVAALNNHYRPWRIQFVHSMVVIRSTRFRHLDTNAGEETDMRTAHADQPARQHNIYVVDLPGGLLGRSTFPWQSAALDTQGGTLFDGVGVTSYPTVLSHELGHALGLWHTHHGVSEVSACSGCWERADGANADVTGDFCSDTPPTPVNYNCAPPSGTDACSARSWGRTAYENYMGYSLDCHAQFTPQQAGRMHCWIQERLTGWLVSAAAPNVSLADALDAPALPWSTGGAADWLGQTPVTHDGHDAAASGPVSHSQDSWVQTSVTGPGTLNFWWKVSSEGNYDFLRVLVDGTDAGAISGEVNWQARTLALGPGAHTVRWRYAKDYSVHTGQDRGWLDQVTFTPGLSALAHVDWRFTGLNPDGTLARPFPTVEQGYAQVAAGGTLKVRTGNYLVRIPLGKPLRLEPYDGRVLLGSRVEGGFVPSGVAGAELVQPSLSGPKRQPDGSAAMHLKVASGQRYQVFTSTNLVHWELWKDFTAETDSMELNYPDARNEPMRFFKLAVP